jgi:hypothetical protein
MSADESAIVFSAGMLAALCWLLGFATAVQTNLLVRPWGRLTLVIVVLFASLGVVAAALITHADPQVRSRPGYIVLFLAVAADTLAAAAVVGSAVGLPVLDGYVRRRNTSAGWAVAGLWLGTGIVNAAANVGRGDTIYTTLGPLALALGALTFLVAIMAVATSRFRAVRLDRDKPAGVRLGGLFIAWGLILGRAVAGDWESTRRTCDDFGAYGWPVLVLLVVAMPVEWVLRPTIRRPRVSPLAGIGPAAIDVAAAVGWVLLR